MNTLLYIIFSVAAAVSSAVGFVPQLPVVVPAPAPVQEIVLGAAPSPIAGGVYTLSGGGTSPSATSVTLSSLTIKQTGQKILTADLRQGASDKFYVTLEPGSNSRQEIIGCSAVTQNGGGTATLTGCSRGLSPLYPYAASTTLAFTHGGGSQAVFGDAPQLFNDFKAYVDSAVVSGAVDASLSAKGIVEKASAAEAAAHAAVGSGNTTAPLALTSDLASSTRTANTAQVVVASSTDGYIDISYINTNKLISSSTTFTNGIPIAAIGKTFFWATTSQTWTVPSGVSLVDVACVGGGSGGDSSTSGGGQGGGGGAYVRGVFNISALTSVAIGIGAGGAANTAGGNTTFGSLLLALGGGRPAGGVASTTASTTIASVPGSDGSSGWVTGSAGTTYGCSGYGGGTFLGGGAPQTCSGSGTNPTGAAATVFGSGGGGGGSYNTGGTNGPGGTGKGGACLLTY